MRTIRTRPLFNVADVKSSTAVYGSGNASAMLRDLANGNNSLDIVVIGDSNTGSSLYGMWGYHNGLSQTLNDRGYTMYGSPIAGAMTNRNTDNAPDMWRGGINLFAPTGALQSGNTSGGSTSYSVWSPTGNWTRYGSSSSSPDSRENWAYLASSSAQYYQTYGLYLDSNNPLAATGQTVYLRMRYGTFTASGGGFCPMVFNGSGTEMFGTRQFQSSQGSAYSFTAWELPFTTSGTTSYRSTWSFVGTGSNVCKGPLAMHSSSFYRKTKGWSVHSHAYLGGFSSDAIASVIKNNVPTTLLQTYLQEMRERQIVAGGTGRVLIMFEFGVNATTSNQPETPSKWTQAALDIWNTYSAAWIGLGYPASDLACVGWVSHQIDAADNSSLGSSGNMIAVRAAANQLALANPSMTIVDIKKLLNYNQLLMGTGEIGATGVGSLSTVGKPYYQRISNWPNTGSDFYQHLSGGLISSGSWHPTDGYTLMCNNIIGALLSA